MNPSKTATQHEGAYINILNQLETLADKLSPILVPYDPIPMGNTAMATGTSEPTKSEIVYKFDIIESKLQSIITRINL